MILQRRRSFRPRHDFSEILSDDESDASSFNCTEEEPQSQDLLPAISSFFILSMVLYILANYASVDHPAPQLYQPVTIAMKGFRGPEDGKIPAGKMSLITAGENHFLNTEFAGGVRKEVSPHKTLRIIDDAHIIKSPMKITTASVLDKKDIMIVAKKMPIKTTTMASATAKKSPSTKVVHSKTERMKKDTSKSFIPGYRDSWDPLDQTEDLPVFWHIPKAGGSAIQDIMGSCHNMVLASEVGIKDHTKDTELKVVKVGEKGQYINIDTTTKEGIIRAKDMKLAESNLVDIIITPLLHEAGMLFSETNVKRGRVFALFRHPIERAVSMFNYLQYAEWEPTYNSQLQNMTLHTYAVSEFVENNFMTRKLANVPKGNLDETHLKYALDVLRTKILVGLTSDVESSLDRFEKFFEWKFESLNQEKCREDHVAFGRNRNTKKKTVVPQKGTPAYKLLEIQNHHDIRIYEYAVKLYKEQGEFVIYKQNDFRLSDVPVL